MKGFIEVTRSHGEPTIINVSQIALVDRSETGQACIHLTNAYIDSGDRDFYVIEDFEEVSKRLKAALE